MDNFTVTRQWETENWHLCEIEVREDKVEEFCKYLNDGPWYIHFWSKDSDRMYVVYKDKMFIVSKTEQDSWQAAIDYGMTIKIPLEQLTFPSD